MTSRRNLSDELEQEAPLLWHQERSKLEATELICDIMQRQGVSRTELAKRLGKTKGYVTQLLDGSANMTIATLSDVLTVLGHEFHPHASLPMQEGSTVSFSPQWLFRWNKSSLPDIPEASEVQS
jgi:transcriptional regulator with XRE-family HTH domain